MVPYKSKKYNNTTTNTCIKAKCLSNQSILNQIISIKQRIQQNTPNTNFLFTLQRAIESVRFHPLPILSYNDLITLKYIGPTIANQIIFTTNTNNNDANNDDNDNTTIDIDQQSQGTHNTTSLSSSQQQPIQSKKRKKTNTTTTTTTTTTKCTKATTSSTTSNDTIIVVAQQQDQQQPIQEDDDDNHTTTISTTTKASKKQTQPNNMKKKRMKIQHSNNTNDIVEQQDFLEEEIKGKKQIAYEQAVYSSIHWKEYVYDKMNTISNTSNTNNIQWRIVLLIDIREQQCNMIQAKCIMCGILCEIRTLPIGDMMWIIQGYINNTSTNDTTNTTTTTTTNQQDNTNNNSNENIIVLVEFIAGTIIERKTPDDLKSSIFGTRYMEQRLRLQHCNIPQIIYVIEGNINRELYACPISTLHTAIWETRLYMNFHIVQTNHLENTIQLLQRYHRRIIQRTFPRTFQKNRSSHNNHSTNTCSNNNNNIAVEALPTFQESYRSNNNSNTSNNNDNHNNTNISSDRTTMRRRLRKNRHSLETLSFNIDPIIPLHMKRFISYNELCTKIYYDREIGRQSIYHIHMAMLKQVPTIQHINKCNTITNHYPTIHSLCQSYYNSIVQNQNNRFHINTNNNTNSNNTDSNNSIVKKYPTAQYMVSDLSILQSNSIEKQNNTNLSQVDNENDDNDNESTVTKTSTTSRINHTITKNSNRTIGHRSSNELYMAYTGGDEYITNNIHLFTNENMIHQNQNSNHTITKTTASTTNNNKDNSNDRYHNKSNDDLLQSRPTNIDQVNDQYNIISTTTTNATSTTINYNNDYKINDKSSNNQLNILKTITEIVIDLSDDDDENDDNNNYSKSKSSISNHTTTTKCNNGIQRHTTTEIDAMMMIDNESMKENYDNVNQSQEIPSTFARGGLTTSNNDIDTNDSPMNVKKRKTNDTSIYTILDSSDDDEDNKTYKRPPFKELNNDRNGLSTKPPLKNNTTTTAIAKPLTTTTKSKCQPQEVIELLD